MSGVLLPQLDELGVLEQKASDVHGFTLALRTLEPTRSRQAVNLR
ncbi:hypothetical protein [Amycolatopsis sp. NPDC051071]